MQMCLLPWPPSSGEMTPVLPKVMTRSGADEFNGWCGYHAQINSVHFVNNSQQVVFQTLHAGEHAVFVKDLGSTDPPRRIRVKEQGSVVLLGCHPDEGTGASTLIVEWSSLSSPPEIWAGRLSLADVHWRCIVGPNHEGM